MSNGALNSIGYLRILLKYPEKTEVEIKCRNAMLKSALDGYERLHLEEKLIRYEEKQFEELQADTIQFY